MGDSVQKAVLLFVALDFADKEDGVERNAGDDDGKEDDAENERDGSRQLRMIQLTLRTIARATRHAPSVIKNAIAFVRLAMRIDVGIVVGSTRENSWRQESGIKRKGEPKLAFRFQIANC